jgi:hypothetical protein
LSVKLTPVGHVPAVWLMTIAAPVGNPLVCMVNDCPVFPGANVVLLALVICGGTFTLMTKLCEALVSTPPLACSVIVMVEPPPVAFAAGVYVNVPVGPMAGAVENCVGLVLPVTLKCTVWPASSGGPGLIDAAA